MARNLFFGLALIFGLSAQSFAAASSDSEPPKCGSGIPSGIAVSLIRSDSEGAQAALRYMAEFVTAKNESAQLVVAEAQRGQPETMFEGVSRLRQDMGNLSTVAFDLSRSRSDNVILYLTQQQADELFAATRIRCLESLGH